VNQVQDIPKHVKGKHMNFAQRTVSKRKRYAKEMKVSERIDCPQILLRTD